LLFGTFSKECIKSPISKFASIVKSPGAKYIFLDCFKKVFILSKILSPLGASI
jgi:hypothetical protein